MAADVTAGDGLPRYLWEPARVEPDEYAALILASVIEVERRRREYDAAMQIRRRRASPGSSDLKASA